MAVLAFLSSALYWPGVAGAATTPRWALFAAVLPWLLRRQSLTLSHLTGGLFVAWACLTMLWAESPLDGVGAVAVVLITAYCFCLGSQLKNLDSILAGAALGIGFSSAIAIIQFCGWVPLKTATPAAASGLFVNCNFMGEAAALIFVALVAERLWLLLPLVAPALFLSEARGAMLAVVAALLVHYRKRWRLTVPAALVAVVALAYFKNFASFDQRVVMWHSTWDGLTLFGHGIGSYWQSFLHFDLRTGPISDRPEYAHNEFLHYAFELGYIGVFLFVAFCASLYGPINTARLVLIALFVEACFEFPLHEPTTAFLGMVAAGHAVRSGPVLVDLSDRIRRILAARRHRQRFSQRHGEVAVSRAHHAVRTPHPRIPDAAAVEGAST